MRNVHLKHIDFRWVWSKILPQVYDDSLSYYEQLCKLGAALDELATQCEGHFTEIYALIEIINEEIERIKGRLDVAEGKIEDLIEKTGVLREDVDYLLSITPSIEHLETVTADLVGGNTGEVLTKNSNEDYDYVWSVLRGIPAYNSADEGKLLAVGVSGQDVVVQWIDPPTDIPEYYTTDDGKVLKIQLVNGEPQMFWGLGLPEITLADANKILAVNGDGVSLGWKTQTQEVPGYDYTDRLKSLCVNTDGNGIEWALRQGELPPYSLDESHFVLSVNEYGNGIYWQNNKVLGVEAFEGAGLPSSDIVAKTGDIYRDTTTNKLYWCVRYIDPDNITDLTNLGVVFNNTLDITTIAQGASFTYDIGFESNSLTFDNLRFDHQGSTANIYSMWYRTSATIGSTCVYQAWVTNPWFSGDEYKTVTNFQGNDATNSDLIRWLSQNATFTGAGSTWIEVSELLPIYDYTQPLTAPSFRASGDYTLSGSATSGTRITLYLTGATAGTYMRVYIRNKTSNYTKKYEYMFLGNANGHVVDNNVTPAPTGEDWYVETTPSGNGYLILNTNNSNIEYELVATFDYKP